jgi:hypothetical protein
MLRQMSKPSATCDCYRNIGPCGRASSAKHDAQLDRVIFLKVPLVPGCLQVSRASRRLVAKVPPVLRIAMVLNPTST